MKTELIEIRMKVRIWYETKEDRRDCVADAKENAASVCTIRKAEPRRSSVRVYTPPPPPTDLTPKEK